MNSKLPVDQDRKFFCAVNASFERVFTSALTCKCDIIIGYEKRKQMHNMHRLRKMLRGI